MAVFDYVVARSIQEGLELIADSSVATLPIGGGTDLLPLLKDGVTAAERLVAIDAIPGMDAITQLEEGLSIGAAATIADVASHPVIRSGYPVLAQAAIGLATPQIRTVGTIGGNLNQRPRCWYFRSPLIPCLKKGGDRCYALAGTTKYLCVTGGDRCYIVHPSDIGVALSVLDASVEIAGPAGARTLAIGDFFSGPGPDPTRENVLEPGEIVTRVLLPANPPNRSLYLKVRERESGDFALVSVAAALWLADSPSGPVVRKARIALGGVAPAPYRAVEVEQALTATAVAGLDTETLAPLTLPEAAPLAQNGYKVPMARGMVQRAVAQLIG